MNLPKKFINFGIPLFLFLVFLLIFFSTTKLLLEKTKPGFRLGKDNNQVVLTHSQANLKALIPDGWVAERLNRDLVLIKNSQFPCQISFRDNGDVEKVATSSPTIALTDNQQDVTYSLQSDEIVSTKELLKDNSQIGEEFFSNNIVAFVSKLVVDDNTKQEKAEECFTEFRLFNSSVKLEN